MLSNNECFKQRNLSDTNFQKFHLYTDTEIGIDSAIFDKNLVDSVSTNIYLILKHCDEDCDTDSEILKKTIGLCERDIKDLDNMMEKTGQHHLARKVHNYRHF